ncbi:MAG: universal stress protein [Alphaproteobacteria bacterium]|nr:universal stress protein [Alphaproteobacteria bacterium]
MTVKRILVHYDGTKRAERALSSALELAEAQDAHLIGCAVEAEPRIPTYAAAQIPADVIATMVEEQRQYVEAAKASFDKLVAASAWTDRSEFVKAKGDTTRALSRIGRGCDLIVLGQSEPDNDFVEIEDLPDNLVLESGRPVLIIPYIGKTQRIGGHVLLCWTDTREAARALSDALPLLNKASKVTVLSVGERPSDPAISADDAARFLAAHGISADLRHTPGKGLDVGTVVLNEASDIGADMIVMGAYGHSRLRETILGGVTHTILKEMTVPVLMSH